MTKDAVDNVKVMENVTTMATWTEVHPWLEMEGPESRGSTSPMSPAVCSLLCQDLGAIGSSSLGKDGPEETEAFSFMECELARVSRRRRTSRGERREGGNAPCLCTGSQVQVVKRSLPKASQGLSYIGPSSIFAFAHTRSRVLLGTPRNEIRAMSQPQCNADMLTATLPESHPAYDGNDSFNSDNATMRLDLV